MAIEGSLADVSLADICQLLALGRKTGCLTVTDRSNFGYIYFRNGRVIHALVLNRPDRLGELLVRNGVIPREDLVRAMEEQTRRGGKRLGEILVEMGALSQEELERWITVQIEEAVYHLFTWSQGTFHFKPDELPDERSVFLVSLNADALLMEGARRVDEWTLIERKIPSMDMVFKLVRDPRGEEGLELSKNQEKLLPLLDGTRTVHELVQESGLVEFETGKALYELIQAGFVQEVGRKTEGMGGREDADVLRHLNLGEAFYRAGMLEDASRAFEEVLRADPGHGLARFRLGLIALRNGEPEKALQHFSAMAPEEASRYGVLRNRALSLELLGHLEEALRVLAEAAQVRPDDAGLSLARGIVEWKLGRAQEAYASFKKFRRDLGNQPPPAPFFAYAVLAAAAAGQAEEAVALGREGLQLHPDEPAILVNTGVVLDVKGDHEAAEQYFLRAVAATPDPPPQAHKNLGDQALRRGDRMGARAHYERAVKLNPALGDDVYVKLGEIALAEADKSTAILLLRRALQLNPKNLAAQDHLLRLAAF